MARKRMVTRVSVPSRGILFPNQNRNWENSAVKLFPSPLGVSYFQMQFPFPVKKISGQCFRPLSGYLISK